ncbi:Transglycosylase SLT domain-containing protein [Nocardia amikacinitolerans]|uniref:lytic transglycosylase domain-containing protein n=1 Tax=Nocardia amikacinitolerans TaxID=756689 RepID=UPI000AA4197A|nr:lytic murein transglycosylase [Nocardia amikacinitolerans]MCP2316239.1 Transglycosylase SLT domain-containing protein [Nocardia amikacinitolerans]
MSALVVAGLVASGSAAHNTTASTPPQAPEALLAASSGRDGAGNGTDTDPAGTLSRTVGLLPVQPESPRKLRAMTPSKDGLPFFGGTVPLHEVTLPAVGGALGIPEIVLAAYRNAELAMQSSMPGCGLSWNLLAGIGRIESGHAGSGRTDAAGTTVTPIFGPALDGTLPGNEVIRAADGGYVRAIGPMQFLPGTWSLYAADGNGDGVADPHNVFDASLAAGKYLCSGGMDLRDPAQELRAVLRYNNSMSYAANVLSWSTAYRTGGKPSQVTISPELVPPGSVPIIASNPDMSAAQSTLPTTTSPADQPPSTAPAAPAPTQVMITIPGLPPIPCGIFCPPPPPPANPCAQAAVPAPMPRPGESGRPFGPRQQFGAEPVDPNDPARAEDPALTDAREPQPNPACVPQLQGLPAAPEQGAPAPAPNPAQPAPPAQPNAPEQPNPEPEVATTPEPVPAAPAPTEQPGITLPFGIVIPLPPAPPQG